MTTIVMPGLSPMLEASNKTRMGTVDALASQYQRIVQAVPLISMRWPSEPDGSIESPAASVPRSSAISEHGNFNETMHWYC